MQVEMGDHVAELNHELHWGLRVLILAPMQELAYPSLMYSCLNACHW
jgi:hypothetical protein